MIKPQILNLINSSFLLWLENFLLRKGECYQTGVNSRFFPVGRTFNNYYTYSSPVQPQICDGSITPPMTGIFVGSNFYQRGQSPFVDINYKKNQVYFTSPVDNVSGIFPLNEINILNLGISEEKLLFETKFDIRKNNISSSTTGISNDSYTCPSIYIKSQGLQSENFCFGGTDETTINMGAFLFFQDKYSLDACCSILSDSRLEHFGFFTPDKMPFNIFGGQKETGSNFNYSTLNNIYLQANSGVYIKDVTINSFRREYFADFNKLNPDIYWALADFEICRVRNPRSSINNL